MSKVIDLTGETFGRLTVLCRKGSNEKGRAMWKCECVCGEVVTVVGYSLTSGNTKSCTCLQKDRVAEVLTKHGMGGTRKKRTPEYSAYIQAKARCTNHNTTGYENYGGRGIKFLFTSFEQFFAELGFRPEGKSLDRTNNDGNYEPRNVRWATRLEQNNNQRRTAQYA